MLAPVLRPLLLLSLSSIVPAASTSGVAPDARAVIVQGDCRQSTSSSVSPEPRHSAEPPTHVPPLLGSVLARRRLRIVIYARYSTDEQNPRSIDDQSAKCQQYIDTLGLGDVQIVTVNDAAVSGEHTHRPGIDRVWELVESEGCDLIVAEDLSRLYRHSTRAMQLVEAAVDSGIRVIAINSHLDTAEEEGRWRMGGHIAAIKAEMDNSETRQRILRAMESRWRDGYAVGAVKPGYIRVPTRPATEREPARGPFRDEKDEKWTSVIRRAYEMIAANEPTWLVAEYLTKSGIPKNARARLAEWTEENVIHLIRSPIYRGEELFRVRHNEKKFRLGRSVQVPTPPEQILHRDVPHLAHVPRRLWEAANRVIDDRNTNRNAKSGEDHPHRGVPLDSRGPLSQLFFCQACGAKMYRNPACYRCANARPKPNLYRQKNQRCWNRCTPSTPTVHENLAEAIIEALLAQDGWVDALVSEVVRIVQSGMPESENRVKELQNRAAELHRVCGRLAEAVEVGGDLTNLVDRLRARQDELKQVQAEIEQVTERANVDMPIPTAGDVREVLSKVKETLLGEFGRETGPLLRRLIDGKILAVPYRLFDRNTVHLRAHFTLNLVGLLPEEWRQLLKDLVTADELSGLAEIRKIPMVVDLFKPRPRVSRAMDVYTMVRDGLTIAEAARRLGLPETTANRAYKTGKAMTDQGLTDAYVLLKDTPEQPSFWGKSPGGPDVVDAT